jgi:hypothetical protein
VNRKAKLNARIIEQSLTIGKPCQERIPGDMYAIRHIAGFPTRWEYERIIGKAYFTN